ncbi:hypothetical protein JD844_007855 [Phrynosoma platyrhinos]|uniref:HEAT repeat-containing protein 7A n=1 Tax=Phrynosoma platyrhinos TaxID=52577 RepID=A0ABQ7T3Y6_PHRPL|nr:hypothetical protein JD844_007855 [Phrynosoma platyrhinos]
MGWNEAPEQKFPHCKPLLPALFLLIKSFQFLLPESSSPYTQERISALSRITKLICCITRHCIAKGMKDFKIGEVAACLTLCCSDPDESLTKTEDNPEYREILQEWEEEKIFWLAWFSDISFTTMVSKSVKFLYYNLEHISNAQARQEVLRFLCLLANSHAQEVVKTLLGCSLQCDCTATAMWHALTAFTEPSTKVLNELQATLLERPLQVTSTGMKPSFNSLAATAALYEILKHPSPACKEILKSMYPTLSISLLCHITYTVYFTPQEIDIYWRTCIQQKFPTPIVPFRSALRTFKALVRRVSSGDETLIMNKRRGSELLLHRSTHQQGIAVFARILLANQGNEQMFRQLMLILDTKEDQIHITVMTFLVEMAKLKHALPDILARLREASREVNVKALKLLPYVLRSLNSEELSIFTVEVAARVIPLFDDASNKVRLAAISTFSCLFELIRKGAKEPMKEFALQSLVPLMVHLHDESTLVTQACWIALRRADRFLKSFIQMSIQDNEPWTFCTNLVSAF